MALPGKRYDAPHLLVHRLADHIVAAWPKELRVPPWLRSYEDKTSYVGGISRFDDRQIPAPPPAHAQRGPGAATTVLILGGADGLGAGPGALEQCATAQQLTTWTTLGTSEADWTDDPWPQMCGADVVVTHAGQSCIADVAAAQRPAVIIPQPRPYDEQQATSRVLRQYRLAVVLRRWPDQRAWPALVTQARASGPDRWRRWNIRGAAARAADAIEATARRYARRGAVVRTAMITTVHGRHEHLRRQIAGLRRSSWSADMHVVVALADPMIRGVVAETNSPAVVADCDYANGQLPVAQGRNIGATAALRGGAELLVFLEVAVYPAQR